jgi:hypothetical protein
MYLSLTKRIYCGYRVLCRFLSAVVGTLKLKTISRTIVDSTNYYVDHNCCYNTTDTGELGELGNTTVLHDVIFQLLDICGY